MGSVYRRQTTSRVSCNDWPNPHMQFARLIPAEERALPVWFTGRGPVGVSTRE